MKKRTKIISSLLAVGVAGLITVASTVSCAGVQNGSRSSNSSSHTSSSPLSSYLNKNNALPLSNANQGNNDGLNKPLTFAWNNTIQNSSNLISLSSTNKNISFNTNANNGSIVQWYISNDDSCLISQSINLGASLVKDGASSITLPDYIFNKLNTFTYYVFAIISNKNMTYPVQVSGVLNLIGNVSLQIASGWVKNTSGVSALCKNNPLTLEVSGLDIAKTSNEAIKTNLDATSDSSAYTYTWNILNHNGSASTNIGNSNTNTFNYTPATVGYLTFQCIVTKNGTVTNTVTLNVYVQDWANLQISNKNMVNNILTITNTNQSLTSTFINSFVPANSAIAYQWYKSNVNESNLTNNLLFTATGSNSNTLSLDDILPTYTTDYKLEVTFNIGNTLHTIVSNIVQVYYQNNAGSISISAPDSANISNGILTLNNGNSVTLSLNASAMQVPATYQWQQEINDSWTNIANATSSTYTYTEKDNTIAPIRVVATPLQNWNDGSIYSNIITIQTPAISSTLSAKIKQLALSYFNDPTNLSNIFASYFMNSANSNYWWLWNSLLAGWWKEAGGFYTSSNGKSFSKITTDDILACFKLTSISVINGSFNNGNPTGSPRLSFNFEVIGSDVYIKNDLGSIAMPKGTTFAFSSPIYIGNVSGESSGFYFGVASNGAVTYSISNSLGSQTDMKYYWGSAWGLNFNGSVYEGLVKQGFFNWQTTNSTTVLYNWLDAPATIVINNNTTPALPNFYEEALNSNISITLTPNVTASSSSPLGFNLGTKTLSVAASLSNGNNTTFSYTWQSMKEDDTTWTNLNNSTNSLTLVYPSTSVATAYIMLYKVTVSAVINGSTITTTYTFYVNYEPTNASKN